MPISRITAKLVRSVNEITNKRSDSVDLFVDAPAELWTAANSGSLEQRIDGTRASSEPKPGAPGVIE
jgi:hypothetical protein